MNLPVRQSVTVAEPARLQMTQPGELQIRCWQGMSFAVEGSSNLMDWTLLTTVTNASPMVTVGWSDPAANSQTQRFYRAVMQ